ncbi:enterobactin/ferric enterobactin esterase [Crateriforma conspicua]|uniref:alpha/beta hydrolase-fold protein n=1 Tax=Crateriforma conspicua TaxID=2527996 RepID=UPI001188322B|nr:alpha/beta hydrolase-fold protein [Crateriforma conspicua]QDV64272.1 enterobactin/ferric enterobactin esterase [Crateriforma conspicua]
MKTPRHTSLPAASHAAGTATTMTRQVLTRCSGLFLLAAVSAAPLNAQVAESYPVHPDAVAQDSVPRGEVTAHTWNDSKIYPGTHRDYFVYVPSQYDGTEPAAVMVFQDGQKYVRKNSTWALPNVFDNLIHRGEMPVTIAICINPGVVPGGDAESQDRFNRSFEYDSVSDRYARFVIDEILPTVGKKYRLTDDPNLRAIGGSSSGAIAALGVAWHRPDQFRRVFSTVGTYVGLRGGHNYPTMIRKTEPKPLKIFLQDGSNDLNIYAGDWWNANRTMLSALQWAGYDVENVWGEGGHNGKHGSAIFPDAMKWLWADWQTPITTDTTSHPELKDITIAGESWRSVSIDEAPESIRQNMDRRGDQIRVGDLRYQADPQKGTLTQFVDGGSGASVRPCPSRPAGLAVTPDRRFLLVTDAGGRYVWSYRIDPDGNLVDGQPYSFLHQAVDATDPVAAGAAMTREGRLVVATDLGVQIFDQPGRVHAILNRPVAGGRMRDCAFGGEDMQTLFVVCGDDIFARDLQLVGHDESSPPAKPPKPRL